MIAVFGETPYQILNGMNLAYSEFKDQCVLFIVKDMFNSDVKFELALSEKSEFIKDIYYIERIPAFKKTLFNRIIFKLRRIIFDPDKEYFKLYCKNYDFKYDFDRVITHKYGTAARYLYAFSGKNTKLYHFEEGIGEYIVLDELDNSSAYANVKCKYLSAPQLYPSKTDFNIKRSPFISDDKGFLNELDRIFGFRAELDIYKDHIYFGQAFSKDYNMPGFDVIEKRCFEVFEDLISSDSFTFKAHPRSSVVLSDNFQNVHTLTPWECLIPELKDIEDRVIISISSTCLITPKLLLNKEPYVICLAKIFEDELKKVLSERNYYERLITFLTGVKGMYVDPNRFFIPKSIEELHDIIKTIDSMRQGE